MPCKVKDKRERTKYLAHVHEGKEIKEERGVEYGTFTPEARIS